MNKTIINAKKAQKMTQRTIRKIVVKHVVPNIQDAIKQGINYALVDFSEDFWNLISYDLMCNVEKLLANQGYICEERNDCVLFIKW